MQLKFWKQLNISVSLYLKCAAILSLFILSLIVVSCGSSGTNANINNPDVTVTINLDSGGSPTPPLPEYSCNAWVTNTSPVIYTTSTLGVYAKFTHNVNGNPEGIGGASGIATVLWPDGNTASVSATTTSDGLAVFLVSTTNRFADLNKIVLVTVTFSAPNIPQCTVGSDRAAFFTLVISATGISGSGGGTPPANATGTPNTPPTVTSSATPVGDPTTIPTVCVTPKPRKGTPPPCG